MSIQMRIQKLAEQVRDAGLRDNSMQAELEKIAVAEDLSANEIRRVAEIANRGVQVQMHKTAKDRRFVFELANPGDAHKHATKHAGYRPQNDGGMDKTAEAIATLDEDVGDPYAPFKEAEVPRAPSSISRYETSQLNTVKMAAERLRQVTTKVSRAYADVEQMIRVAESDWEKTMRDANVNHDDMVRRAVEMIMAGLTLPDIYAALRAAVSGSGAMDEDRKAVDGLAGLIMQGLRKRKVPVMRWGFQDQGDPKALEALSNEAILALCKRAAGITDNKPDSKDISIATVKEAQRFLMKTMERRVGSGKQQPYEEAKDWLNDRPSMGGWNNALMDETVVDNLPNGKVIPVDGDNEFIITVRDLIGDQRRLRRSHDAREYLGLKLKQIESTLRNCQEAKQAHLDKAEALMAEIEEAKTSGIGSALGGIGKALSGNTASNVIGAAGAVTPLVAQHMANKGQEAADRRQAKMQKQQPAGIAS